MNDAKIISAILALHERFIEEPTEQKSRHISDFIYGWTTVEGKFINGCYGDTSSETLHKILLYDWTVRGTRSSSFSPESIAHLETVAKETLR